MIVNTIFLVELETEKLTMLSQQVLTQPVIQQETFSGSKSKIK